MWKNNTTNKSGNKLSVKDKQKVDKEILLREK